MKQRASALGTGLVIDSWFLGHDELLWRRRCGRASLMQRGEARIKEKFVGSQLGKRVRRLSVGGSDGLSGGGVGVGSGDEGGDYQGGGEENGGEEVRRAGKM